MSDLPIKIVPLTEKYVNDFTQLNFEWLEKFFYIEDYDREVLTKPYEYIINKRGHIFMALIGNKAVGTVALIDRGDEGVELSKMAVTDGYQGLRIGQKMMYYAINFAGEHNIHRIFLDSNRSLTPAITLYHKVGFKEISVPEDSPYERCNIRMELMI